MTWINTSELNLWSLVMTSPDGVEGTKDTCKVLIKRIDEGVDKHTGQRDVFRGVKKGWIKRLNAIIEMDDEEKQEKALNRVLKSIYDYGDSHRVWVS